MSVSYMESGPLFAGKNITYNSSYLLMAHCQENYSDHIHNISTQYTHLSIYEHIFNLHDFLFMNFFFPWIYMRCCSLDLKQQQINQLNKTTI